MLRLDTIFFSHLPLDATNSVQPGAMHLAMVMVVVFVAIGVLSAIPTLLAVRDSPRRIPERTVTQAEDLERQLHG